MYHIAKSKRRLWILYLILLVAICASIICNAGSIGRYFYERAVNNNWGKTGYKIAIPLIKLEYVISKDPDMLQGLCYSYAAMTTDAERYEEKYENYFGYYMTLDPNKDRDYWVLFIWYYICLDEEDMDTMIAVYEENKYDFPMLTLKSVLSQIELEGNTDYAYDQYMKYIRDDTYQDNHNYFVANFMMTACGSVVSLIRNNEIDANAAFLDEMKQNQIKWINVYSDIDAELSEQGYSIDAMIDNDTLPFHLHALLGEDEPYITGDEILMYKWGDEIKVKECAPE